MKVAVIGAGSMGGFHAELLAEMADVDAVLIVDADAARAESVAARVGGRATSFGDAIGTAEAIVIASPPERHREAVEAALDAGLHVLCEKPLTDTLASSIELTGRIEAEGAHVELGFQRRHDPGFVALRSAIEGRVHLVRLTALDPLIAPMTADGGPPPEAATIFRDSSVHDFDFVRWVTHDEVTDVSVEAARRDGTRPSDPREIEAATVTMRLAGGGLATLDASWLHPSGYDIRVEVVAEGSALTAGLSPRTPARHLDWDGSSDPWTGYLERFEPAYRAELAAFLACCRGIRPSFSSARDGLEAMRIAVAATRSFTDGQRVSLDEIPGLARREVA